MIPLALYIMLIGLLALFTVLGLTNNENRFYGDIVFCLLGCMLAFILGMYSVSGDVQLTFSEICTTDTQACTWYVRSVPIYNAPLSYFFTGLGIALAIITLLKVIDVVMRYFADIEEQLEGGAELP